MAMVGIAAQSGTPDDALLAGFSEERARLSAITSTGMTIARRDPDAARAYIESHVADPDRREEVLSMLAQAQAAVAEVQRDMIGRQRRLFAPPPADSKFEISPLHTSGTGGQNPPH